MKTWDCFFNVVDRIAEWFRKTEDLSDELVQKLFNADAWKTRKPSLSCGDKKYFGSIPLREM
jgi:hypothetical protein